MLGVGVFRRSAAVRMWISPPPLTPRPSAASGRVWTNPGWWCEWFAAKSTLLFLNDTRYYIAAESLPVGFPLRRSAAKTCTYY